ncbi:phage terminase large subunit-like protein [Breoghania corrubedonensis]|uniref:Phage terminase large subunit-like protein n=1 Tax=Breoghania corrubedonensis TaxID=665038 RepID=A0A2T5V1Q1_9HYPH|nr:terminase family protein [Breoghania corrubedonensis]PTW57666.1 phage terminase large subunit-like protein [Breoghania corrubedonensis]
MLASLERSEIERLAHDFALFARPDQTPPAGNWTTWLVMGGRGAGKTRTGAEWVRGMALGLSPYACEPVGRIALVGETQGDVRDVMVEGVSGLLSVHPAGQRPQWQPSRRRLEWANGAVAQGFSAEDPEALRGPQFAAAWCDELAKWRNAEETWDMLQFGLRLGERPRQVATTTPRPIALMKRLLADPLTAVSRAATRDNATNLAPGFLEAIVGRYAGTRLGRQELDGELIEDRVDALWRREAIEEARATAAPRMGRIVVAIDPPASSGKGADACGLVVAGLGADGHAYVLADGTMEEVRPVRWGRAAIALYHRHAADCLIAEVNQGGEMVTAVLSGIDASVPVKPVRATRGKWLRAEPVAALYEQGRVHHVGAFSKLEDEMCDFGLDGLSSGRSPDRLDALVWALTALMLSESGEPKVRAM